MAELVVALDFDDTLEALNMATALRGHATWVKVGLELFVSEGPTVIHALKGVGYNVFLDLKLHDIPNTVSGAVRACARAGADLITIHMAGGERMCRAAVEAAAQTDQKPMVFGVTVLTSLTPGELPGYVGSLPALARSMAHDAAQWGVHGIVCSGHEVAAIKGENPGLKCLTPGIRLDGASGDDQRRVMSPAQAVAVGADYLVVGRPITKAQEPMAVAARIRHEMNPN